MAEREGKLPAAREAAVRGGAEPPGALRGQALLRGDGAAQRAVRPDDQRPGTDLAREQEEVPGTTRPRQGEEGHAGDAGGGDAGGDPGNPRVCGGSVGVIGRPTTAPCRGGQR